MKPWSCGALGLVAPAATALVTSVSTSARVSHDKAISTSFALCASLIGRLTKIWRAMGTHRCGGIGLSMLWRLRSVSKNAT